MDNERSDFEIDYCESIAKNIDKIIKDKGVTQNDIVEECKKQGVKISQSTISNILQGKTKMSIISLLRVCQGLGVTIGDVLPKEERGDSVESPIKNKESEELLEKAYRGYLGEFHVYFFPTISGEHGLLHGVLNLQKKDDSDHGKARMVLYTNKKVKKDGDFIEVTREYRGDFRISLPMRSGYCTLKCEHTDESCFFVFHHFHIFDNLLKCKIAAAATTSAGSNKRPTIHRMFICRKEIENEADLKCIQGQLKLNESEILIKKSAYDNMIKAEEISPEFIKLFEALSREERYYTVSEASLINSEVNSGEFSRDISVLRDYSAAPKYNKVSMKSDEFIYQYYMKYIDKDEG